MRAIVHEESTVMIRGMEAIQLYLALKSGFGSGADRRRDIMRRDEHGPRSRVALQTLPIIAQIPD
jgi:hypothetical protein